MFVHCNIICPDRKSSYNKMLLWFCSVNMNGKKWPKIKTFTISSNLFILKIFPCNTFIVSSSSVFKVTLMSDYLPCAALFISSVYSVSFLCSMEDGSTAVFGFMQQFWRSLLGLQQKQKKRVIHKQSISTATLKNLMDTLTAALKASSVMSLRLIVTL